MHYVPVPIGQDYNALADNDAQNVKRPVCVQQLLGEACVPQILNDPFIRRDDPR